MSSLDAVGAAVVGVPVVGLAVGVADGEAVVGDAVGAPVVGDVVGAAEEGDAVGAAVDTVGLAVGDTVSAHVWFITRCPSPPRWYVTQGRCCNVGM